MTKDRLARYEATLARMTPPSAQYDDQVKRIEVYRKRGHIALGQ